MIWYDAFSTRRDAFQTSCAVCGQNFITASEQIVDTYKKILPHGPGDSSLVPAQKFTRRKVRQQTRPGCVRKNKKRTRFKNMLTANVVCCFLSIMPCCFNIHLTLLHWMSDSKQYHRKSHVKFQSCTSKLRSNLTVYTCQESLYINFYSHPLHWRRVKLKMALT